MEKQVSTFDKIKRLFSFSWEYKFLTNDFVCGSDFSEFLGYKKTEMPTLVEFFSACHLQQVDKLKERIKYVISDHESTANYFFINTATDSYLSEIIIHYVKEPSEKLVGVINIIESLPPDYQDKNLFKLLFENSSRGLVIANSTLDIISVNKAFCEVAGYTKKELTGQNARILDSEQYAPEFYQKLWEQVEQGKIWSGELLAKNKQGNIYVQQAEIQRIEQSKDNYFYIMKSELLEISHYSLIHKERRGESRQADILNKKAFTEKVAQEYKKLNNTETIVIAVFSVKTLQKTTKKTIQWLISQRFDAVNKNGYLGLINDDIFAVCQVAEKNIEQVDILLSRMLKEFAVSGNSNQFDVISNVKMAASVLFVDSKSIQELLVHSVKTLLAIPFEEHPSLTYFDRRLATRFSRRKVLAKLLQETLSRGEIEVYYQPIIDIRNMKLRKFEALFRISLDTEINYTIHELIMIAEEYNWIEDIDSLVSKMALEALTILQKYYGDKNIGMSLNRSLANDSQSFNCLEKTFKILQETDINLKNVTLELTESAFFENLDKQQIWIDKLKKMGVTISLDGFGTGYSSLSYLNNLPINFVKIDRSFVTGLTLESNEYQIIKMLCKLTHKIGGKVIAEGVETEDELKLIARAKVDMVQGYIFSKPVSLETLLSTPKIVMNKTLCDIISNEMDNSVRDIMGHKYHKIASGARLGDARQLMAQYDINFLLVVDDSICCGVLYEADLHAALSPYLGSQGETARDLATLKKRIHQVMDKDFDYVDIDSPIEQVEDIFLRKPAGIIVVTGAVSDICHGFVSINHFLNYKYMQDK